MPPTPATVSKRESSNDCFGAGTQLLLANGRLINVEDVKVDDDLLGPDGTGRRVTGVHYGRQRMYRESQGIDGRLSGVSVNCDSSFAAPSINVDFDIADDPRQDEHVDAEAGQPRFQYLVIPPAPDHIAISMLASVSTTPCELNDVDVVDSDEGDDDDDVPVALLARHLRYLPHSNYLINSREARLALLSGIVDACGSISGKRIRLYRDPVWPVPVREFIMALAYSAGFMAEYLEYGKNGFYDDPVRISFVQLRGDLSVLDCKFANLLADDDSDPQSRIKYWVEIRSAKPEEDEQEWYQLELDGKGLMLRDDYLVLAAKAKSEADGLKYLILVHRLDLALAARPATTDDGNKSGGEGEVQPMDQD
ncbi:uncharacterized protein EHS24_001172 [Apiotrichum porosum]|uniref:Hom-end-associated Hint domain-containing protein n=1 Tax=Apiotrichum porosum TaxID=105984 RepID=A0A427XK52_9TREE|nr:uncharacterized protein EHS24_001172 [Apiotrichum porosum]RSH79134.1 hypothetical protein EHS24_001172 [Apiotrichum porosum]